jgi:Holliday junction DNA helicase RuvA
MITHLHGRLAAALPTVVVIDVQGVGYEVLIPLSSFDRLPAVGQEVKLLTHLVVREDAHLLYGFMSPPERDLFRLLIHTVSGIGPKIALNVLSGLSVTAFRSAVAAADVKALASVSGVGRKTAERIVVELKDKLGSFGSPESLTPGASSRSDSGDDFRLADAMSALGALGFKPHEAQEAVRAAAAILGPTASVEQLVRACLRKPA